MYSTIILNIGGCEWVDASVQLWMTLRAPFILGRYHQFGLPGLVFAAGLPGLDFVKVQKSDQTGD